MAAEVLLPLGGIDLSNQTVTYWTDALPQGRNHAELLQLRELVDDVPMLRQPPVPQAMNVDTGNGVRPAARRHAQECPDARTVARPTNDHAIPLGNKVF